MLLKRVPAVSPDGNLEDAMKLFALDHTHVLPGTDQGMLVGVLARSDVLQAYPMRTALSLETGRKAALLHEKEQSQGALEVLPCSPAVMLPAAWCGGSPFRRV